MRACDTLYAYASSNQNSPFDIAQVQAGWWPHEAAPRAHVEFRPEYALYRLPQPFRGRVFGALHDGQFEIRRVSIRGVRHGLSRRRRYGEAAGLFDAGDVNIEPLAWQELPSISECRASWRGVSTVR